MFVLKLANTVASFYIKEQSPKRKFEINILFFEAPQKWTKIFFKLVKGKHNFFSFSSNLAFKTIKEGGTHWRRLQKPFFGPF